VFYTFRIDARKMENKWERTNVTNLLRNRESGTYYARVKVNGKQKWRTLETAVFSVAKLRLGDTERELRADGQAARGEARVAGIDETMVAHFIAAYQERTEQVAGLAPATRERRGTALKAVTTTWPDLPGRDVRRITANECRTWAAKALREGTGFVAPRATTKRAGMSASAFNKTVDALRAVFEIARERGVIYKNPATEIAKAPMKRKRLSLPSPEQFQAIVRHIANSGSKWSEDCADLVRLLAYSGMRLREGTALRWSHVDTAKKQITAPGTKTESSHRIIPLFPALGALLEDIRRRRGEEPADNAIARIGGCRGALEAACAAVGVARMNHHDLRHLFATRCIESGVDIPTVSRWLGHSDGGTLAMQTYGHLRQEHSQAQAAKVAF
jgi:integrase